MADDLGVVYGKAVSLSRAAGDGGVMMIGRVVASPEAELSADDRLGSPSHFSSGGRFTMHISRDGAVFGELSLFDEETAFRWETRADAPADEVGHVVITRMHIDEHVCRRDGIPPAPPAPGAEVYDPSSDSIASRNLNPPLHTSKPGSPYVIFLDFDGHDATGSAWGIGVTGPYDIDGNTGSFSATELTRITQIWQLMSEDYAPFEITVTTNVAVYNAVSESRRVRCAFTITDSWSGGGGVAYVGVFSRSNDFYQPGWVFPSRLSGGASKSCGEAGSHEVGHNMGLSHDGVSGGPSYYQGHGSGAVGWAPIMGVGYSRPLVQWSSGEYANANENQDDMAIISGSSNGFGYRADDHADSSGSATTLNDGATPAGTGIISTRADVDYFSITLASAGSMTFDIQPSAAQNYANVDIQARLYQGSTLLQTSNPDTSLSASITQSGSAGATYYLRVDGVGRGSVGGDGYSDYGSLGAYQILYSGPPSGSAIVCGNSVVESGEQCDPPSACCSSTCQFRPSSTVCRASTGVCDVAETCTGSSSSCPSNAFRPSSYVCRSAANQCDVAETCTGSSSSCPSNTLRPSGFACNDNDPCSSPDTCNGAGVCSGPTICACGNGILETGEQCDDGNLVNGDCCSSTCQYESTSTVCRPSSGPCDVADTCNGAGVCSADALRPSSFVCRPSTSFCDLAETCTGSSKSCPTNAFRPSGVTCNDNDPCSSPDTCNGAGVCTGPSVCACGNGVVDPGEQCDDGNLINGDCCSSSCQYEPNLATCSTGTCNGQCNGGGTCVTAAFCCLTNAHCEDGNACTTDVCANEVCQNNPAPSGTPCDDGIEETTNDVCSADSVCAGENLCASGCGLHGICFQSVCQCQFGWDADPSCSVGPTPLNLGFAAAHVLDESRDGRAYTLLVPAGESMVIRVRGSSATGNSGGPATRAPTGVVIYGSFSEIPNRPDGLVVHEFASESPELEEQALVLDGSRSGLLFVSVFRAPGTPRAEYELMAGDPQTGNQVGASSSPDSSSSSSLWLIIAIVGGILLLLIIVIATVVYIKSGDSSTMPAAMAFEMTTAEDAYAVPKPAAPFVPVPVAKPAAASSEFTAKYDFNGREADELSFSRGETLIVMEEYDDGWAMGRTRNGVEGIFPMTYVEKKVASVRPARSAPTRPMHSAPTHASLKPLPMPKPKPKPKPKPASRPW